MKENTLYSTENYMHGKLSDDIDLAEQKLEINTKELAMILNNNITNIGHRCISVYRDCFAYNGDIYNVCLSCGDFYKNNKFFYLSKEGIEQFKNFKFKIR